MNRIGLEPDYAVEFIKKVQNSDFLDFKGIFTHLANAEIKEETEKQFACWNSIIDKIDTKGLLLHILNTAGSMTYDVNSNMVRMGIAIYGLYPDLEKDLKFGNGYLNPKKNKKIDYDRAVLIAEYLECDINKILATKTTITINRPQIEKITGDKRFTESELKFLAVYNMLTDENKDKLLEIAHGMVAVQDGEKYIRADNNDQREKIS